MPALIAAAFVTAKRPGGDIAVFLRAIVASENDERVLDEFPAGAPWVRRGFQPIDQAPQRDVVFVNIIMPRIHRRAILGPRGASNRSTTNRFVWRVWTVIGVGRVIEKKRLVLGLRPADMRVQKFHCMIGMAAAQPCEHVGTVAFGHQLLALFGGAHGLATVQVPRSNGLVRAIALGGILMVGIRS